MLSLEGRVLGGCKLIRKIGEGGMGEVYLAEQQRMGNRLVAIKIVQPGDASRSSGSIEDTERRFQREAALLGQFSHPNILPVHDSGVEDGLLYLVMQYAPEGSLSDAIHGRAAHTLELPASVPFAVDLIGQVADALQYTHDRGVIHRDVKPGNVLIRIEPDGHWHALLADFGVARGQETTTQRTMVTGTFAYMSPEQFNGKFSPASDQYALGAMSFLLLSGHTPFEGDLATVTHGHLYDAPPSLRALNPAVPAGVEAAINRTLEKDPAKRFPSVAEFARALRAAASGAADAPAAPASVAAAAPIPPVAAPEKPVWPAPTPPRPRLGRTWIAALAAAVLLVGVVGASGLLSGHQQQTNAQATQTAQAQAGAQAGATARANASATAAAQTAAAATAAASLTVLTATGTATLDADVMVPPPPPSGAGALVLQDPAPTCDQPQGPTWIKDNATNVTCDASGHPLVAAQTANQSACIEQQATVITDGYLSAIVAPQSGGAILSFRAAVGQTTGNAHNVSTYYFKVDRSQGVYGFFKINAAGQPTTIKSGGLASPLAQHFAMGALFKGSAITLYINGQQIAAATDATFTQGWIGLCTDGAVTYSNVQAFKAG